MVLAVAALQLPLTSSRVDAAGLRCGDVILAGSQWLGGAGVDVHYNGMSQGTGSSCGNNGTEMYDLAATTPVFGLAWQCVEMVNRLYASRGWYPKLSLGPETNYGAKWIYTYAAA